MHSALRCRSGVFALAAAVSVAASLAVVTGAWPDPKVQVPPVSYYCMNMDATVSYADTTKDSQAPVAITPGWLSGVQGGLAAVTNDDGVAVYRSGKRVARTKEKGWMHVLGLLPGQRVVLDRSGTRFTLDLRSGKETPVSLKSDVKAVLTLGARYVTVHALSSGALAVLRDASGKELRRWKSQLCLEGSPSAVIGDRYVVVPLRRAIGEAIFWIIDTIGGKTFKVDVGSFAPDFCTGRSPYEMLFCGPIRRSGDELTDVVAMDLRNSRQRVMLSVKGGGIAPLGLSRDGAWLIGLQPDNEAGRLLAIRILDGTTRILGDRAFQCVMSTR